jgi:uncharacterized cupredoxin-like copper-binding protein
VLPACAEDEPPSGDENPPAPTTSTVEVELDEYTVTAASESAPPGTVIFTVTNAGQEQHNFSVLKTELEANELPKLPGGNADTSIPEVEIIGFLPTFGAGDEVTLSTDLTEGSYVLICNLVDHYGKGMTASFDVSS